MGKFNWRAGIALASQGIRENREQKRAYERMGDEVALQSFFKLGTPLPPELIQKYPMLEQLSRVNPQQMANEQELRMIEEQEKIRQKYKEPKEPSEFENQMGMYFGIDPSIIKMLPPEEKSKAFREFSEYKAKVSQDPNAQALLNASRAQQLALGNQQFALNELAGNIKKLDLQKKTEELKSKQDEASRMSKAVDELVRDWGNVPKEYKGYVSGILTENRVRGINDPKVNTFLTKKRSLALKVAKSLEGSRMSDQDRAYYLDLVLNLRIDNPEAAKANAEGLKWFFNQMATREGGVDPGERPPTETVQIDPSQMSDEELINAVNAIRGK